MRNLILLIAVLFLASCYAPSSGWETTWRSESGGDTATVTISIAWPWNSAEVYQRGEYATMPPFNQQIIYKSLQDNNVCNEPYEGSSWWRRYYQ